MSPLTRWIGQRSKRATTEIRTKRLMLRPLRDDDLADIARLAGDWEVASMTARIPYPYTVDDARQWLRAGSDGEFVRGIEYEGQLIGISGYTPAEDRLSAEVGYWIGKPFWGQGFATEAARAVIDRCFVVNGFARVICCHFADNPASARVIEKLGFKMTGECSCWCEARRREAGTVQYQLLRPRGFGRRPAA